MRLRVLLSICAVASLALACKLSPDEEDPPPAPIAADDAAQVFAEQICASLFTCECTGTVELESEAACVATLTSQIQADLQLRLSGAPVWNDECAGQMVDAWREWACAGPAEASRATEFDLASCPLIKGTKLAGVQCSDFQLGDDCAPGLSCVTNVCVEATVPVPVGQRCGFDWEQLPCAAGNYCEYDDTAQAEICKPLPSAGDPCQFGVDYLCGPASADLLCGPSGVCESTGGLGQSCAETLSCGPELYCDGGQDFTCQAKAELGEGCGGNAVCPADASCIGNICTADPAAVCSLIYLQI